MTEAKCGYGVGIESTATSKSRRKPLDGNTLVKIVRYAAMTMIKWSNLRYLRET